MIVILLSVFLVLSALVHLDMFTGFDVRVTMLLQQMIPRSIDVFLSFFSLILSSEVTALILILISVFVFLKKKKVFFGLGAIILVYIVELIGKILIVHPGPPEEFFRYSIPFWFPSAYIHTLGSFPSGHVSRAFFFAIIIYFLSKKFNLSAVKQKMIAVACGLFAIIMVISRIYLGEHWFSDTFGGMFLGSSMGLLAIKFYDFELKKLK